MYFSKTLADNLYVLQYPTRKADENANDAVLLKSYVKPVNQEIKIEYKLDTASRHYDAFKGEQLAIAADGKVGTKSFNRRFYTLLLSSNEKLLLFFLWFK